MYLIYNLYKYLLEIMYKLCCCMNNFQTSYKLTGTPKATLENITSLQTLPFISLIINQYLGSLYEIRIKTFGRPAHWQYTDPLKISFKHTCRFEVFGSISHDIIFTYKYDTVYLIKIPNLINTLSIYIYLLNKQ